MLGTLNGALEAREIVLPSDAIRADVEGLHEVRDRIPVLTEVRVHYSLRIPANSRDIVDRALERHQSKCPTANTLKGAVHVSWTADIVEEPG